jgi:hypothetical protein
MESAPGTIRSIKIGLEIHPELQSLSDSLTKYNPNGSDTFDHLLHRIAWRFEYQDRRRINLEEVGESGLDGGMYAVFEFDNIEDFNELLPKLQKMVSQPLTDYDVISPNS